MGSSKNRLRRSATAWAGALLALAFVLTGCSAPATTSSSAPANPALILATTTSTQDSGPLDVLIPAFKKASGYTVKTVAVGTGQALTMGQEGNADVLLVHAPSSEKTFMDGGFGVDRRLVMNNRSRGGRFLERHREGMTSIALAGRGGAAPARAVEAASRAGDAPRRVAPPIPLAESIGEVVGRARS
ncbi:MAG: hypothetical protein CVT65_08855 [Actinobacteria bacterium HGW-Actinobacteria-5]|jgi:hypothetical protein|nr:MAG: hypothetical protein CVT65_08855 [Actinobacteria bacterium HGW-Actinobacteria-5]